jgi:hypothetical protein
MTGEAALRLVHGLPADQRDVLLLRVVADLPVEEVATVLERSARRPWRQPSPTRPGSGCASSPQDLGTLADGVAAGGRDDQASRPTPAPSGVPGAGFPEMPRERSASTRRDPLLAALRALGDGPEPAPIRPPGGFLAERLAQRTSPEGAVAVTVAPQPAPVGRRRVRRRASLVSGALLFTQATFGAKLALAAGLTATGVAAAGLVGAIPPLPHTPTGQPGSRRVAQPPRSRRRPPGSVHPSPTPRRPRHPRSARRRQDDSLTEAARRSRDADQRPSHAAERAYRTTEHGPRATRRARL